MTAWEVYWIMTVIGWWRVRIRSEILKIVQDITNMPVSGKTNLYFDLGVDSLSFISLLLGIEEEHSITFDITEMEECLEVERLIASVENKVKEREQNSDPQFIMEPGE